MNEAELAEYVETFKSQPLYQNKFNLTPEEKNKYLELAPEWFKKWQQELDKIAGK
jgi:hypothetical protein